MTGIEDICNIIWSGKRSRLETSPANRLRQHHATMPKLRSSGIFILALPGMIVGCTKCRSIPPGVAVAPSFSAAYRPKDLLMWKAHKLEMSKGIMQLPDGPCLSVKQKDTIQHPNNIPTAEAAWTTSLAFPTRSFL